MESRRGTRIAVFFTHDVSLEVWEQRGMFSREIRFYQELAKAVGEVWLFTYGQNDERYLDRLGPNIRLFQKRCQCPPSHYAFMIPFVYRKQLREADAIRIHQVAGAIPALLTHWLYRKPLIVRAGFQWLTFAKQQRASRLKLWLISTIERFAYRSARAIIHTTQHDADVVAKRYRIDKRKLHIIPNWIDTEHFKPLDVEKQPGSVCFVGRLEEQKNLGVLVDAMRGVDGRLILYGEGTLRQSLEEQAQSLGVDIQFRGRIANEDLPVALNMCELFVLPSAYEGHPKALLEAMACGLPVIGTDVQGITSAIVDGKTGVLCEQTPVSIRQSIKELLSDRDRRIALGGQARQEMLSENSLAGAIASELPLYSA